MQAPPGAFHEIADSGPVVQRLSLLEHGVRVDLESSPSGGCRTVPPDRGKDSKGLEALRQGCGRVLAFRRTMIFEAADGHPGRHDGHAPVAEVGRERSAAPRRDLVDEQKTVDPRTSSSTHGGRRFEPTSPVAGPVDADHLIHDAVADPRRTSYGRRSGSCSHEIARRDQADRRTA